MITVLYIIVSVMIVCAACYSAYGLWKGETSFLITHFGHYRFSRDVHPRRYWLALLWNFGVGVVFLSWLMFTLWSQS